MIAIRPSGVLALGLSLALAPVSCAKAQSRLQTGPLPIPSPLAIDRWAPLIGEASLRFGIPESWIRRVMRAESGGRTMLGGRPIVSSAGAMGLMQVMPATWDQMRRLHGLGTDPHDPRDNILAGTAYLAAMHARFGYPGLFAAYNAGPGRYARHLATGRRLPAETRAYVTSLTGAAGPSALPEPAPRQGSTIRASLFADVPGNEPPPGLFVPLTHGTAGFRDGHAVGLAAGRAP